MGGNCTTPTMTTLPSYTETVKGTELPAFVAAGDESYTIRHET